MLEGINVKKAKVVLGTLKNRINGSNKSKAKLSILDKIRKYYLELVIDANTVELEKLEQEKNEINESLEAYKKEFDKQMLVENNEKSLKEIERNIKKEEFNLANNEINVGVVSDTIKEKQAKLDEINAKAEINQDVEIKPIESEKVKSNEIELENLSKTLEEEANKVVAEETVNNKVEDTLKETEENLKNEVNSINAPVKEEKADEKENVEIVKDDMISKVNSFISKYNDDIITLSNTLIQDISVAYEQKLADKENEYADNLEKYTARFNMHLSNANIKIKEKDEEISSLKEDISSLNSTINDNKTAIAEKDKEISGLNEQVTSLKSTIEANKIEMSAKDQEIARLKVFEQRWMLMSQAMAPVTQEVPTVTEESTKTK